MDLSFAPFVEHEKDHQWCRVIKKMNVTTDLGYKPPSEFEEVKRDPLVELKLTDSTELWLLQWPLNNPPDFDGQEVSLKLQDDRNLGSFVSSSGKSYDLIDLKSQDPGATVFLSSASETKVVGKFSRHVSFLHYPDPSEFQKHKQMSLKEMAQRSSTSISNSAFRLSGATKSSRSKHLSQSTSIYTASTPSSQHKGSSSKLPSKSKVAKGRSGSELTKSSGQSLQDSGRASSVLTNSGSAGHSQERKSKKLRSN